MRTAFFNACRLTRAARIVALYISTVLSSIDFLFLVDASPAPSEQVFDPRRPCLAIFCQTHAGTAHTHPLALSACSVFVIPVFLIPLRIDFLRFFPPVCWFYVALQLLIFAPSSLFKKCALARILQHSFFLFPLSSSTAAGVIAGLVTECSTFIYAAMLSFSPNCVPSLILCGLFLFAVLEECGCFDCAGSLFFFFFFFYTAQCVLRL